MRSGWGPGIAWILAVSPAMAMGSSARFEIPPQPMPAALKAFAAQAAPIQLLYVYSAVENVRGNCVRGELEKHEALLQLLRGTGLEAVFVSDTEVIIRAIGAHQSAVR